MQPTGPRNFLASLSAADQSRLFALEAQALQAAPFDCLHWRCGGLHLGLLSPQRAAWLAQQLPGCSLLQRELVWRAEDLEEAQRSDQLQAALLRARDQGLLSGWRNERFSFWHTDCVTPEPQTPAFLSVERSGFCWLGMLSHAVHVNGFLPNGRLWCARRALSKATDPGLLDNVTAGGLPSGETVQSCLLRELAEEAGLFSLEGHQLQTAGSVRTSRLEPQGWHDEYVHVFNLTLGHDFVPANQDGEVAEFMCLSAQQVLARMLAGECTVDAVQTLLQGLRGCAETIRAPLASRFSK
jgi:ADP-ribose pyrophosphatase YjhB (NUDIX family)